MEVECWSGAVAQASSSKLGASFRRASIDGDASVGVPPDFIVPFTSFVDIGVRTNVRKAQPDNVWRWHCLMHPCGHKAVNARAVGVER